MRSVMFTAVLAALFLFIGAGTGVCGPAEDFASGLASVVGRGSPVAVAAIYNGATYDITAFGESWRDRIEAALSSRGVVLSPRKDLAVFMEELDRGAWTLPGAEVVVAGVYYLAGDGGSVELYFKAFRASDKRQVLARRYGKIPLSSGDRDRLTVVLGNVSRRSWEPAVSDTHPLPLVVRLNRSCFRPGQEARLEVRTSPGAHLYIFSVASNGGVTRLLPNRLMPDAPLSSGVFVFPPQGQEVMRLVLYPPEGRAAAYEGFKVVASPAAIDFSSIPVPDNRLVTGGRMEALEALVSRVSGAVQRDVRYWIAERCQGFVGGGGRGR